MDSQMSEQQMIQRLKGNPNDQDAIEHLINHYGPRIGISIQSLSDDLSAQDVEELITDTTLKALGKIGTFTGEGSFSAWICRIGRNQALDFLKTADFKTNRTRCVSLQALNTPLVGSAPADPDEAPPEHSRGWQVRVRLKNAWSNWTIREQAIFTVLFAWQMRKCEAYRWLVAEGHYDTTGAAQSATTRFIKKLKDLLHDLL